MDTLAETAREKKDTFLKLRASNADFETLKVAAKEYTDAVRAWHKVRFPKKKFNAPSVGYLIRAL